MIKQGALRIAQCYLFNTAHNQHGNHLATMGKISIIGIFIATFSLALVVAIMSGFELETYKKMQGIHASLIMQAAGQPLAYQKIAETLSAEFPQIESFAPYTTQYLMITDTDNESSPQLVVLKGIEPAREAQTTTLESTLREFLEEKKLTALVHENHILIGDKLAQQLNCTIGDTVTLLYAPQDQTASNKIILEKQTAVIGGIFKTGIEEFDANLCVSSLAFLESLIPTTEITHIGLSLTKNANAQTIINQLKQRFGLHVYSWKDLYPALVSALILEKYASILVLLLIVLVACLTIVSLLFMHITQKRADIALLKSMGASNAFIRNIFLSMGMIIAFIGATTGALLAFGVGFILKYYIPIDLPDAYYVAHLPVCLDWWLFFATWAVVIGLSFLTTLYAVQTVKNIKISQVLRFEG